MRINKELKVIRELLSLTQEDLVDLNIYRIELISCKILLISTIHNLLTFSGVH